MQFKGTARRLDSIDIARLAATIGCGEDHLHAVMDVETRGGGFDRYGRPKMLFEPHVFYRNLSGAERERAVHEGLAYRRWGMKPYPKDSYPRLERAAEINCDAALRACSWGLGQILGENHQMAGYSTAREMVDAFLDDEAVHLAAMVEFIVSAGLDDDLRREDWRGFARGYNGPGYAKHGYHTKLMRAFEKWQRIPDTPFEIDRGEVDPNAELPAVDPKTTRPTLRMGNRSPREDVRRLQADLAALGYHAGAVDGVFGQRTRAAVMALQADHALIADGVVGPQTWAAMDKAQPARARFASVDSLRDSGSGTIADADRAEAVAKAGAGVVLGGVGLDTAMEVAGKLDGLSGLLPSLQAALVNNWIIIGVGAAALVGWFWLPRLMNSIRERRVADHVAGKNLGR